MNIFYSKYESRKINMQMIRTGNNTVSERFCWEHEFPNRWRARFSGDNPVASPRRLRKTR